MHEKHLYSILNNYVIAINFCCNCYLRCNLKNGSNCNSHQLRNCHNTVSKLVVLRWQSGDSTYSIVYWTPKDAKLVTG